MTNEIPIRMTKPIQPPRPRRVGIEADPKTVSRKKWGDAIDAGFQLLPDMLIKHQRTLGLKANDLVVVINLTMLWWYADSPPFPTTVTIGRRMGASPRTVQRSLQRIEKLGLIKKIKKPRGERSIFDLTPLASRLAEIAKGDPAYLSRFSATNRNPSVQNSGLA